MVTDGLVAILMISLLVSCASRPDVVGQWQRVDGDDKLTFSKDGTFKAVDSMGAAAAGRYALHADGTLYWAITHTDVMQPQIKPVEDLKVNIVGVHFHRDRPEITIITDEAATVKIYRRIEPPAKPIY
jgi:hypothetical protein